jgi:hypothetical protein
MVFRKIGWKRRQFSKHGGHRPQNPEKSPRTTWNSGKVVIAQAQSSIVGMWCFSYVFLSKKTSLDAGFPDHCTINMTLTIRKCRIWCSGFAIFRIRPILFRQECSWTATKKEVNKSRLSLNKNGAGVLSLNRPTSCWRCCWAAWCGCCSRWAWQLRLLTLFSTGCSAGPSSWSGHLGPARIIRHMDQITIRTPNPWGWFC